MGTPGRTRCPVVPTDGAVHGTRSRGSLESPTTERRPFSGGALATPCTDRRGRGATYIREHCYMVIDHTVIDLWVNAISGRAAEKFLGQTGYGEIEGFFGSEVRGGTTRSELLDAMDRLGVDRAVLTSTLSSVEEETLALVADHRHRLLLAATVDLPNSLGARAQRSDPGRPTVPSTWCGSPRWSSNYPLNDALYYPVYATCEELGLPVSINIGHPRTPGPLPLPRPGAAGGRPDRLPRPGGHRGAHGPSLRGAAHRVPAQVAQPLPVELGLSGQVHASVPDHVHGIPPGPGPGPLCLGPSVPPHGPGPGRRPGPALDDEAMADFLGGAAARLLDDLPRG